MRFDVRVSGHEKVIDLLEELRKVGEYVGDLEARIGSPLPYAHWIEEGFYRSGRPGKRKAGPARMFNKGAQRIRTLLKPAIVRNAEKGVDSVRRGVSGVLAEGTRTARSYTPVRSGDLRGSIHTVGPER